jgi:ubiquinone/menaquinone biosynthesis C-methylase UbiE
MIKSLIKKFFSKAGYELKKITRSENVPMYDRLYGKESVDKKRFYNIGAGSFSHSCWTNVDLYNEHFDKYYKGVPKGINYDLFSLAPIPVESNTAEMVYCSHTIEHVTNEAVQNLLNESYRILKPEGIIRLVTPNIDLQYRAWKENDRDYFYWLQYYTKPEEFERVDLNQPLNKASLAQIFLEDFASSVSTLHITGPEKRISDEELEKIFKEMSYEDALDYCISKCPVEIQKKHPGQHLNWFNEKKLTQMLSKAGFSEIWRSSYGQSFAPVMRDTDYFDTNMPKVSLYMEARK